MAKDGEDFATFAWGLVGGKPIPRKGPILAKTPLSERVALELKKRGFKFVGPVIVYAWMQAVGMVNDHDPTCFRRKAVAATPAPRQDGPPSEAQSLGAWGCSSVGRAPALQVGCQGFESPHLQGSKKPVISGFFLFSAARVSVLLRA